MATAKKQKTYQRRNTMYAVINKSVLTMKSNKEIYLLRLAITTCCILRCRYCFVYKNNRVMPYAIAVKAINLFLDSPGKEKILIIYGGEPLLHFDLLKKIINLAQKKAKILGKFLIISVGTNGILLDKGKLDFFRRTNTKLAISLDGQKEFHNKGRVFKNKKGSFDSIFKKIPLVTENIKKENLCVLFGVLPSSAYKMYDNLIYLTNLGFNSINIEPIQSSLFKWSAKQKNSFENGLRKFIGYIYKNIKQGNFLFLNTINRELKNHRISDRHKSICPFYQNLEVYPDGETAFSPFLINSENKNQYIIGDIKDGLRKKYIYCNFNPNNENCKNCWQDYYLGGDNRDYGDSNEVLKLRDIYSIYLAKKILTLSKQQLIFKRYIQKAKKRIFE